MDKKYIYKVLSDFGLSENEITIYLEALNHQETSPYQLAKITNIPRTTVYDVMMSLALKGMIEVNQSQGFEKQQTKIKAKNPSVIREIILKKKRDLTKLEVNVVDVISQLKDTIHKTESNSFIKFYPGIEGAKKLLEVDEKKDKDIQIYTWDPCLSMDSFGSKITNKSANSYIKTRLKLKNTPKELIPLNDWTKHVYSYQYGRNSNYLKNNEVRYIENSIFSLHQQITIEGNIVRIITAEGDENWGLSIVSEKLAATFKSFFEIMWQSATPLTEEIVKSWGENEFLSEEKKIKKKFK